MGDGFVLMRLASLKCLPEGPLDGPPSALNDSQPLQQPRIVLGWSSSIERSRADFVRLHGDVGDEMGQDPDVFDSTFGCDPDRLAKRMAFLYSTTAGDAAGQVQPEPELPVAVGTCTAWEVDGVGWIHSLAVSTDHQGRGLSKILLGTVLHRLRDLGYSSAMLAVRSTSHRAITLYQQWGFAPVLEDQDDRDQWAVACAAAAIDRVAALALPPASAAYRTRAQQLIREPHSLGNCNSHFALCGPAAVLYAALVQSRQAAVIALLQRLFNSSARQSQSSGQTLEPQPSVSALVQRYRDQMKAKEAAVEPADQFDPMHASEAELDFILCRGLLGVMEDSEPALFAEQERYLLEFPPEHGFHIEHGDLALLPEGMQGLLRALDATGNGGIDGSVRWRIVPSSLLHTPEALVSELRAAAAVPGTVVLAGRAGAEGQPLLDHWFVVHGLDLPTAGGSGLGGLVWNYAGHAGSPFKVSSSSADSHASAWFELGFHTLIVVLPAE